VCSQHWRVVARILRFGAPILGYAAGMAKNNLLPETYKLTITFTEPLLGSQPRKDVVREHIMRRRGIDPDSVADELETLDETLERNTTAFHKRDGKPVLYDYMIKGFLKEAAATFNGRAELNGMKNARAKIDAYVFVYPREIPIVTDSPILILERPLRAMTMQGPRVSVARSEMIPAGAKIECEVQVLAPDIISEHLLRTILDYGRYKGIGQWRNGGYGRFEYELTKVE